MSVVGVMMCKDEADVIGRTVGHLLGEVDVVLVADNGSSDGTRDVLARLEARSDGRLVVVDDPDPAYLQSAKMTALAHRARIELGAEWIVPADADEWWYSPFGRIADVLADVSADVFAVGATLYDHMITGRDDPSVSDPVSRMRWRRANPVPLQKVACRAREDLTIGMGNHDAHYRIRPHVQQGLLIVRHFPIRSPAQFLSKVRNGAAAYRAAGDAVPASAGAHWRQWGQILDGQGEEAALQILEVWWRREDPLEPFEVDGQPVDGPMIFDPVDNLPQSV